MPPHLKDNFKVATDHGKIETEEQMEKLIAPQAEPRKYEIKYMNLFTFGYDQPALEQGSNWVLLALGEIGVTAGAHRLWTHRAYKAKMPLQIILIVKNSLAFQNSAIVWIRDHRMHHRYAVPFIGSICFLIPTIIPMYFWCETFTNAWHLVMLRWTVGVHVASTVNSLAHLVGTRPYDKNIQPANNLLAFFLTLGEGFHNNHHVYPWDYRTAELGNNCYNVLTKFIDFFAWVGWAHDLKTVPVEVAKARTVRTGDGSNEYGWVNTFKANSASLSIPTGKLCTAVGKAAMVEQ